mgnify:CR=1 FL=1
MKKQFFIILFVVLESSCLNDTGNNEITTGIKENDLTEYNLKCKVNEISFIKYNAKDSFGIALKDGIHKSDYDSLSSLEKTISFNKEGYITSKIKYNDGVILSKANFIRDSLNRKIKKNVFNSEDELTGKQIFKYNLNGKISEMNSYNNNGEIQMKWIYIYEDNKVTRNDYYSSGRKVSRYIKTYNDEEDLIKLKYLDFEDSKMNYINNYSYNHKENTVTQINKSFYSIEIDDTKFFRKFNNAGVLIEETINDFTTTKYQYEYDQHNNWTKQIWISNEFPRFIIERKIQYYD